MTIFQLLHKIDCPPNFQIVKIDLKLPETTDRSLYMSTKPIIITCQSINFMSNLTSLKHAMCGRE